MTLAPKKSSKGKEREVEPVNLIDMVDEATSAPGASGSSLNSSPLEAPSRTVDIVRIPSSQLRFFPKPPRPPDSSRTSFDGPRPDPTPLSIQNDLIFSHEPTSRNVSGNTVRLRPPTTTLSSGTGLANKFSNLFYIPPPPQGLAVTSARASARTSLDSAGSTGSTRPVEEVEMLLRFRKGSEDTVKERRKLD